MDETETFDYATLTEKFPLVAKIVPEKAWTMMEQVKQDTTSHLRPLWLQHIKENSRHLYKKHGAIRWGLHGLSVNKAVIGIGAGPSFNLNKNVLKQLSNANLQLKLDDQPFTFTSVQSW